MSLCSYHLSSRDPAVIEMGVRFFQSAGVRGLANVEFKPDPRARLTAVAPPSVPEVEHT